MDRKIDTIVIHCSATPEGRNVTGKEIAQWHVQRGWNGIGYHYVVELNGTVRIGRQLKKPGAHAKGYNAHSIGICYVGGMDAEMTEPKDTRTKEQNAALVKLVFELKVKFSIGNDHIVGHNELSNKACPSFDVRKWVEDLKWD